MLLFNGFTLDDFSTEHYFNTSNVTIQPFSTADYVYTKIFQYI